jgi:hypothetical protein
MYRISILNRVIRTTTAGFLFVASFRQRMRRLISSPTCRPARLQIMRCRPRACLLRSATGNRA